MKTNIIVSIIDGNVCIVDDGALIGSDEHLVHGPVRDITIEDLAALRALTGRLNRFFDDIE